MVLLIWRGAVVQREWHAVLIWRVTCGNGLFSNTILNPSPAK
jgi:hypothetical protein